MQRGGWCSFTELHDGLLEEFLDGSVGSEVDLSLRWDVVNGMSCFKSAPCESMLIIGNGTHGGGEGIGDKTAPDLEILDTNAMASDCDMGV